MSKRRARYLFFFEIVIWLVILAGALVATAIGGIPPGAVPAAARTADAEAAVPEPEGYWTGAINGAVPASLRGGSVLRTQDLSALLKHDKVVLVDASNTPKRPEKLAPNAPWLPAPHPVIPGSLWIPGSGMGEIAPETDVLYREQLAAATANNLDQPVVVYCHERCWLSYNAAKRAIGYGYRKVYWYPDGIEGWRAAGLATSTAPAIER